MIIHIALPRSVSLQPKKAFILSMAAQSAITESCLGIIENYKLGAIVGAPTAGTNGNVNPFSLPALGVFHCVDRNEGVRLCDTTVPRSVESTPAHDSRVAHKSGDVAAGRDEFLGAPCLL
jgi:hypothetical protein